MRKTIHYIIRLLFLLMTPNVYSVEVNTQNSIITSEFTLQELGYKMDLTTLAVNPQLSILVPKFSAQTLTTKAYLELELAADITDTTLLKISVNGAPIRKESIQNLRHQPGIEIDLSNVNASNEGYLIEISGANTIKASSRIVYKLDKNTLPIFGRLINQSKRSVPVFVTAMDRSTLETALEFISAIGSYYYPWKITADFQPYPPTNDGTPKVVIVDNENPTAKNFQNGITVEEANQFINQIRLNNFPNNFTGNGVVILREFSPDYLIAAAKVMELQGRTDHVPATIYLKKDIQGQHNIHSDYTIVLDGKNN